MLLLFRICFGALFGLMTILCIDCLIDVERKLEHGGALIGFSISLLVFLLCVLYTDAVGGGYQPESKPTNGKPIPPQDE
ncbi:MAG: hypothetical protein GY829_05775 [Gammaproteobacteria bacterium]|nr:hypothetical protein [Gammaproteobacteria bacterium]